MSEVPELHSAFSRRLRTPTAGADFAIFSRCRIPWRQHHFWPNELLLRRQHRQCVLAFPPWPGNDPLNSLFASHRLHARRNGHVLRLVLQLPQVWDPLDTDPSFLDGRLGGCANGTPEFDLEFGDIDVRVPPKSLQHPVWTVGRRREGRRCWDDRMGWRTCELDL